MEKKKSNFFSARNICILAVLVALVVVLQLFGLSIPMGGTTSMSFVLVPIVLGGILLGPIAGTLLGLIFGIITLFDPMAISLMNYAPVITVFTVLLKGMFAGLGSSIAHWLLSKKSKYAAIIVSAVLAPVLNTGTFIIGMFCMQDAVLTYLGDFPFKEFMLTIILVNFAIELAVNVILAPALYTVTNVVEKQVLKKFPPRKVTENENREQV